ncbi:hypothetical protein [Streptococcus suis]|uniref:Uncharacterized protein n=1 Tax=Streptococcus suis R61 TaxID=996306 RepID=A0AA87K4Q4_STRSU|nr:hypothetical protein [Streptococcus suis]ATZ02527.1 hypothetical protein CVO91_00245 [Streptococcus suis]EHC02643.1 hypothetical protein SSUR61_1384 [Streptococcus suis R61]MBY4956103.1 hypothetical protein [Streptococcus suis]MBY4970966.1 hypothetical protein [Streptococcus suis]MBY4992760.1 hypothetical protein [Streptococcus suis]
MLAIFKPVFASVWKRKETKIFLAFAFLFPTLFLASTFLPKGHNFMAPSVNGGYLVSFVALTATVFKSASDFVLPILALFYLTYTVFKGEADNHTMFLYKDIKRQDIFWAKVLSLATIVLIYTGFFLLVMVVYYYTRIGYLDYATLTFWDHLDVMENAAFAQSILGGMLDMLVCVLLSACLSLYSGVGATMAVAFGYSLGSSILAIFGLASLFPTGNIDTLYEGASLFSTLGTSILVTLVYLTVLAYLTLKYFKKMEF